MIMFSWLMYAFIELKIFLPISAIIVFRTHIIKFSSRPKSPFFISARMKTNTIRRSRKKTYKQNNYHTPLHHNPSLLILTSTIIAMLTVIIFFLFFRTYIRMFLIISILITSIFLIIQVKHFCSLLCQHLFIF
jgi:hypothetical protein